MSLILMVIYCLTAAFFIFGLTLHDEVLQKKRQRLLSGRDKVVPINGARRGGGLRRGA